MCDLGEVVFRQTAGTWEVRLYAAISAMLDLVASSPGFARLSIAEMKRNAEGSEHFHAVVSRCRRAFGGTGMLSVPIGVDFDSPAYETVLIGGALGVLGRRPLAAAPVARCRKTGRGGPGAGRRPGPGGR